MSVIADEISPSALFEVKRFFLGQGTSVVTKMMGESLQRHHALDSQLYLPAYLVVAQPLVRACLVTVNVERGGL